MYWDDIDIERWHCEEVEKPTEPYYDRTELSFAGFITATDSVRRAMMQNPYIAALIRADK